MSSPERLATPAERADRQGGGRRLRDEHLGRHLRAEGHASEVVDKLADALDKALDDPSVQKRLADLGGSIPAKDERTPAKFERLREPRSRAGRRS